ncbi:hypothetical protein SOPP22_13630 [Shewanella sp. OPT22]|nr:hypothetical protein SOPP22_13630 [Shewanella sp. OPT22]
MVPVRVKTPQEAAKALLSHHYAIIKLPDDVLNISKNILADGLNFFNMDEKIKLKNASPHILEGYRALGEEGDPKTGTPDLSESFTAWFRNTSNPQVQSWSKECIFHQTMSNGLVAFADFTERLLKAIRIEIDPTYKVSNVPVINIRSISYLQMNFSRPALHNRELRDSIMGPHEDGHILTILKPTKPGLLIGQGELVESPTKQNPVGVFKQEGDLQPINISDDEAILVPGSPTFYLTGGRIKPLIHAVANKGHDVRQSLMFFINPTPELPIEPWVHTEQNRDISIHKIVDVVSAQYGQPAISQSVNLRQ